MGDMGDQWEYVIKIYIYIHRHTYIHLERDRERQRETSEGFSRITCLKLPGCKYNSSKLAGKPVDS